MHDKNPTKFEEKKALIHLSLFSRETANLLFLRGLATFRFFWHYATYRVKKIFSQLLVFEVFREGKKFPCLGSGIFDHAELMSFLIDCGKHLISDFSIL